MQSSLLADVKTPLIGVIGGNSCPPDIINLSFRVGEEIAKRNCILVCGGHGGVMEAACHGAWDAGGLTVGILPGSTDEHSNPYVKIAIPTGIGLARNSIIAQTAWAVIAIDGEFGTLSELAYCKIYNTPVVGIRTWNIPRLDFETVENAESAVEKAVRKALVNRKK